MFNHILFSKRGITLQDTPTDIQLVHDTRNGALQAFATLYKRHYRTAERTAARYIKPSDAEDLAQEAFATIYERILSGKGPKENFASYLKTTIRNIAITTTARSRKEINTPDLDMLPTPQHPEDQLGLHALNSLPHRWQQVLRFHIIDRMKPSEIAPILGTTPGNVSQLVFRAREGLRDAWISAHVAPRRTPNNPECEWTATALSAYARGTITTRGRSRIHAHLPHCRNCSRALIEATHAARELNHARHAA